MTIHFYDENAEQYAALTVKADMSQTYERFLACMPKGAHILDAGCGSGRDSLYFMQQGYIVTMLDASSGMCRCAEKLTGQPTLHKTFAEIDFDKQFDGIWACASLLHVHEEEFVHVLSAFCRALKDEGILYASWKYGEGERQDGARFYCDMTEAKLKLLLQRENEFACKEVWVSEDVLPIGRKQKWLNVILEKVFMR